jgi:hypothetical protein
MMKKNFVVAAAITVGLCFAGSGQVKPAFAGYWEVTLNPYLDQYGMAPPPYDPNYQDYLTEDAKRTDGSLGVSDDNGVNVQQWHEGWPSLNGAFHTPFTWGIAPGGSFIITTTGKRKLLFHWVQNQINGQDDPNDNPPAELRLKVYAEAYAFLDNLIAYDSSTLETAVGIDQGDSYSGTIDGEGTGELSSVQKAIPITIETNGHKDVESPWITFVATSGGELKDFGDDGTGALIQLEFGWDYDTRAVEIESSAETSYYKDGNGDRQAHTRDANGHLTVDTAATWHIADSALPIDTWVWDGTFNAVRLGSPWGTPQYQWSSSPAGLNQTVSTFPQALNLGKSTSGTKNDSLTTTNAQINLNVTDDDGRQLSNAYNMVFHKPFENPVHQAGEDVDCGTQGSGCTNDTFDPSTTAYLAAGESLTFTETPAKYDFGAALDNIAVGADAAATVGTLLTEEEVPAPTWVKVLEIMKVASSVTSLAVGSPEPDLHPQYTGSYDDFMDAVNDQLSVGNYDDNQERVRLPLGYNDDLLTDIQNSFAGTTASTNPFWNGITNTQNPNGIKVTFTVFPHRKKQKRYYKGDAYSNDGYDGQVTLPVVKPIVVQVEPQFKLDE